MEETNSAAVGFSTVLQGNSSIEYLTTNRTKQVLIRVESSPLPVRVFICSCSSWFNSLTSATLENLRPSKYPNISLFSMSTNPGECFTTQNFSPSETIK